MARKVTARHQAIRASEQAPDRSGKFDVGYRDDSGEWHHIARYSDYYEARAAASSLANPDEEAQSQIGLPESPDTEVLPR